MSKPFDVNRGDNDQLVRFGTQMTLNPLLSWDREAIRYRTKMSNVHFWTNSGIYKAPSIPLERKLKYWNKTTSLSLTWNAENLAVSATNVDAVDYTAIEMVSRMIPFEKNDEEDSVAFWQRKIKTSRIVAAKYLQWPS